MKTLTALADNKRSDSLANRLRRRRFELFRSYLDRLPRPLTLLDVGGTEDFWRQMGITEADGLQITLLNLTVEPVTLPFISSVSGDARKMPQFSDQQFDIVFSNSVIEHVGDYRDQSEMAAEIKRVGRAFFVQTPARSFPIEPHFLFPFFAVLPDSVREYLVMHFGLGWYPKIPDRSRAKEFLRGFQLLNEKQFRALFPGAEIAKERFAGLTKSYLAAEGFNRSQR